MGQTNAKINNGDHLQPLIGQPETYITERHKAVLRKSWSIIKGNVNAVGIIIFLNLFETHPEAKNEFMSFRTKNIPELEYNQILRAHALRVMGTVDKCIHRLDNRENLRNLMVDLGRRHLHYSMKIEYLDLMGPEFISSIKPHLENTWTDEHDSAWMNLFQVMSYYIQIGMLSA